MKPRILIVAVCGLLCSLFVSGYGGMLNSPAADNLKTVALVSVYMNHDFYDVKAPRTSVDLNIFGKRKDQNDDTLNKEYVTLINYGINAYTTRLDGIGNLKWLPVADVLANDMYKKFMESSFTRSSSSGLLQTAANLKESERFSAPNMAYVSADNAAQKGKFISIGGAKDPRLALANLCKDLNVDAVAILEFDMAYRKLITGADMISGVPAAPSISVVLIIVNKDGEVAVNSGLITKGRGKRFEGKNVNMLQQNYVRLDDKSIASYQTAIDKSADDMKKRLADEFSKMK